MLSASSIGTALGIAIALGAGITAYLWFVRRQKILVSIGITSLAAMRWREFSHFVVDALRAQGFDHDPSAPRPQKDQQADVMLSRDDQAWFLGCKQSPGEVITAPQVAELARSVRETGSGGGILATLGTIEPLARRASHGIELLDGTTLWTLVQPLLPQSLRSDLEQRARTRTLRDIQLSWLVALLVGFALAMLLPPRQTPDAAPVVAPPVATDVITSPIADAADTAATAASEALPVAQPAAAPASEQQRRDEAMREIAQLPGVSEAIWASRSTLVVYLMDGEASKTDVASLCATLERYEELRASRLQLQPPPASTAPVRFMQCHMY